MRRKTKTKAKHIVYNTFKYIFSTIFYTLKYIFDLVKRLLVINSKLVIVLIALFWFYENKVDLSRLTRYMDSAFSQFQEGEVAKVEVDCRDNTAVEHVKGKPPRLHTGVKRFRGSQFEDGHIETKFKNKGFGLEPGIVATAGDGLRLGLDLEWVYWRRWGIVTGATMPVRQRSLDNLRGHVGVSYDLPSRWLSNTSIYGGVDSDRTPTMGLRTRIGGGI